MAKGSKKEDRGLFGHDGISLSGKANSAPMLLLVLGLFFFLAPLFLGSGKQRQVLPDSNSSGPTFAQIYPETATPAPRTFVGPQAPDVRWLEEDNSPAWAPSHDFVAKMRSISGMLVIVSLLVVVSLKLMQGKLPQLVAGRPSGPRPLLKVLARQSLSPTVQVCVVQVGTKNLVLSVSDNGAQSICELSPEELMGGNEPPSSSAVVGESGLVALPPARPTAAQVYGQIFKQYLGIFPRFGSPKQ